MPPGRDASKSSRQLFVLADGQAGYFTAGQALRAGYSYPLQLFHVRRGNWLRVARNLYRLHLYPISRHEDLVRWTFWSLGQGVVSHHSALDFHRLGDYVSDRIHLTVPAGFRKRHEDVLLHRGSLSRSDVESHPGFRVTLPARTILDCADSDLDPDRFGDAVRQAVTHRRVRLKRLVEGMHGLSPRGRRRLSRALEEAAP